MLEQVTHHFSMWMAVGPIGAEYRERMWESRGRADFPIAPRAVMRNLQDGDLIPAVCRKEIDQLGPVSRFQKIRVTGVEDR